MAPANFDRFSGLFSLLTNFKDRKRESAWGVGTAVLLE